nr:AlNc14C191G8440 [Albugo laibachii Nc14]|eukprot:CCA23350.1 AlNc14C191G8440 [Albugo laibachii Nc14]
MILFLRRKEQLLKLQGLRPISCGLNSGSHVVRVLADVPIASAHPTISRKLLFVDYFDEATMFRTGRLHHTSSIKQSFSSNDV